MNTRACTATPVETATAARTASLKRGRSVALVAIAGSAVPDGPGLVTAQAQSLVGKYGRLLPIADFCKLAGGMSLGWYYRKAHAGLVPPAIYLGRNAFIPEAWASAWIAAQVDAQRPNGWQVAADKAEQA